MLSCRLRSAYRHSLRRYQHVLAIRREDSARHWERRAALTPDDIKYLLQNKYCDRVLVEPSSKRIYTDTQYRNAGAVISDDLSSADFVFGVKEPPLDTILSGKQRTYAFFSHTHKGQPKGAAMLDAMVASKARFVDYELLKNPDGSRAVYFSTWAGIVGMADGLSNLGVACMGHGAATPFINLPRPIAHKSYADLVDSLQKLGEDIKIRGTPTALGPVTLVITGKGRVAEGAKQVLDVLATSGALEWVPQSHLRSLVENPNTSLNKIYACQLTLEDYVEAKAGKAFDRLEYNQHPERYHSVFAEKFSPYTTMMVNGAFYSSEFPRILPTKDHIQAQKKSAESGKAPRMISIADISCDLGGGIEFMEAPTTIHEPVIYFDPYTGKQTIEFSRPGCTQILAIEILPTELPLDATDHFSASLKPFVEEMLKPSNTDLSNSIKNATICENGSLTEAHRWLEEHHSSKSVAASSSTAKKQVLVLGSGLVAGPAIDCLVKRNDIQVTVASNDLASAQHLLQQRGTAIQLDVDDKAKLSSLIKASDVVISLLPAFMHVAVAELCCEHQSHLVTASYLSAEMKALQQRAEEKGIVILGELGLDPGIDHMSAMALIKDAEAKGDEITSFISFCGGLPEPEHADIPFSFKCSWSARGVLTAALNEAQFRLNDQAVVIKADDLLDRYFENVPIFNGISFEGLANRNSLSYIDAYQLPNKLDTMLRGTLRYPGYARLLSNFKKLGLLDLKSPAFKLQTSWQDLLRQSLEQTTRQNIKNEESAVSAVRDIVTASEADETLGVLRWMSLLSSPSSHSPNLPTAPPLPTSSQSTLDHFALLFGSKLSYKPGERDTIAMSHELGVKTADGRDQIYTSRMYLRGNEKSSAMALTVGLPVALGALHILDGGIKSRGVMAPISNEVYPALLAALKDEGVFMSESKAEGRGLREQLKI